MKRRTMVRTIAAIIGALLVALLCLALYLRFADLSGWRDVAAAKLSASVGRRVTIAGKFEPEIGLTTRLKVGDITLANPDWSGEPNMASVRQLTVELRLLSLVSGPLTFHDIEIEGARVLLEKDADGRANWVFDTGKKSTPSSGPLELVLQHIVLHDVQLTYREPSRSAPLEAGIEHFETTEHPTGMLQINFDGAVDRRKVRIAGRIGTLAGLLNAGVVECDLTGQIGGAQLAIKGDIADLKSLGGVDLTAGFDGGDVGDLRGLFNLPVELDGPFSISAAVSPAATGTGLQLEAAVAGITARAAGTVDSLLEPKILDATVTASGPSIRTVGALTGVADLPDQAFSVSGGVRWEGFPITLKKVEITVGENTLAADGTLGAPPAMMDTDFTLQGQGPDVSAIGALAGIDLPREGYSIEGRVVRVDGGLRVEGATARIGSTLVRVDGTVGDAPSHAGTAIRLHAEGPDLAEFDRLVGTKLPARPFTINGGLSTDGSALALDGVTARVGNTHLRVDGNLKMVQGLLGTAVRVDAEGSDAADLRALVGLEDLPGEAWTARGGVTIIDSALQLDGASVTVGSLTAEGNGRLSTTRGLVGSDLQLHAEDSDLAHALPIFGVDGFPRVPVHADGRLRVEEVGIRLDSTTATAGDIDVAVEGLIGKPELNGTTGHVSVHGPRLSSLEPYVRLEDLPPAPFSVVGDLDVKQGAFNLRDVVVLVDHNRAAIDGTLFPVKGLVGTDVELEVTVPDLEQAGRLAAGLVTLHDLPAEPLALQTHLGIDEAGYKIRGLRATLDKAVANVDGRVGSAPGLVGTDLTVQADGPNSSLISALTGVAIPLAPFKVSGRIERTDDLMIFDHVAIRLGGHAVDVHGSLGEKPRLIGTDLDLHVSGPGTGLIAELTGFDKLPDEPFSVGGSFFGTPEKFTAKNLAITLGISDLKGSIEVDIRGKPRVTARVSSNSIDFGEKTPRPPDHGQASPAPQPAKLGGDEAMVFSKKPIDFGWLQRADADVDITIGTLQMPVERFHDLELSARLVDGRLDVDRVAMVGARGGNGSGTLVLEPVGDDYRVELDLDINGVRFDLPGENAPDVASEPPVDIDVHVRAQGASPHEFADTSNGSIQFVVGRGVMDNRVADLITADILLTLLNAFNPFAKEEVATELECAVVLVTFDQGVATLQPMALQSNKMTMLGHGRIDLGTEKLNLDWITKPRKGIGISASMLTNPYIKLGGTLSKPSIELKPMQALASTGAAVATLGISYVAKGMLDRATAEKKVCKQALEEIAKADHGQ